MLAKVLTQLPLGVKVFLFNGKGYVLTDSAVLECILEEENSMRVLFTSKNAFILCHSTVGNASIVGSENGLRVYDDESMELRHTLLEGFEGGNSNCINAVKYSKDGSRVVTGDLNGGVKVWDTENWKVLITLEHKSSVRTLDYSPDGRQFVSAGDDKLLVISDVETGEIKHTLQGHTGIIWTVVYSPDGRYLSSCGDKSVRVWDLKTGKCKHIFLHENMVWSVAYSPDGETIFSGDDKGIIKTWDAETGECKQTLGDEIGGIHHIGAVNSISCIDPTNIVTGGVDGQIISWNLEEEKESPLWIDSSDEEEEYY